MAKKVTKKAIPKTPKRAGKKAAPKKAAKPKAKKAAKNRASRKTTKKLAKETAPTEQPQPTTPTLSQEYLEFIVELNRKYPSPYPALRAELMQGNLRVAYARPGSEKGTWTITKYAQPWRVPQPG